MQLRIILKQTLSPGIEQALEQRVGNLEKSLESIANGHKELLSRFTERVSANMEPRKEKESHEMGEDSTAQPSRFSGQQNAGDYEQPTSSLSNLLPKTVKLDFPRFDGHEDPTS
ncbi:hypothetical protein TorRG33x02_131930 [Trema orientale]|uniref:Uncharacterized protein n=1 Tax=Trema orientale TaxID=63057 RepID=A0A2P5EZK0_TREOI|nr:hypothetical protein TorRG33x02_131930 [Trema orientale]